MHLVCTLLMNTCKNGRRICRAWKAGPGPQSYAEPFGFYRTFLPQRAQRSKKFEISSEIANFEREWKFLASHPPRPYFFVGISRHRDLKIRSRLKLSIEIENFERDQFFLIVGPSGSTGSLLCEMFYRTIPAAEPQRFCRILGNLWVPRPVFSGPANPSPPKCKCLLSLNLLGDGFLYTTSAGRCCPFAVFSASGV